MAPVVSTQNISHFYGKRRALHGVSFDVHEGEIFGFLGPNGGGKTTLFKILSTALSPVGDSGSPQLSILGFDVQKNGDDIRRRLGVVFQSPSLDKKLTICENLKHHGHLYGLRGKKLRDRAEAILKRVGLYDRMHDRVENLSGGLKRRAEIAKALLHEPKLLLLDEPTTGLDPGARLDVWNYLKTLNRESGVTCLVTTHLMEEADKCDRLAILHEGEIVAAGSPKELKQGIGGEILTIKSAKVPALQHSLKNEFNVASQRVNGTLRVEQKGASDLMMQVRDKHSDDIESMTLAKPSLEDVFIKKTGHRFWEDA